MEMVNIKINGMPLSVPAGSTILEAARMHGIEIPTLCYLREINEIGACRICVVEVVGMRNLVAACVYPVAEGMEILTNSKRVFASRKTNLELILSTHNRSCLSCVRSGNCELQKLCKDFRIYDEAIFDGEKPASDYDDSAVHMVRDNPSACCAAAVPPPAPNGRMLRSSDLTAGALTPISAPPLTRTCPTWPAYPAASVSLSAPPARWRRKTTPRMYGVLWAIRPNT